MNQGYYDSSDTKDNNSMSLVGIYSVRSTELDQPPADREYEQKGLYDLDEQTWADITDSRIRYFLNNEEDYSFEDIQEAIETSTTHVYYDGEVPGTVTMPAARGAQPASD